MFPLRQHELKVKILPSSTEIVQRERTDSWCIQPIKEEEKVKPKGMGGELQDLKNNAHGTLNNKKGSFEIFETRDKKNIARNTQQLNEIG